MAATKKTGTQDESQAFSDAERAAMKERAAEVKTAAKRGRSSGKDVEADVLAKIAEMEESDRAMAEKVHAVIRASAPELEPKLWYGMPAYAKDGKAVCFFQPARKFKSRYATLGFNDDARLDDGAMWPTAYALTELTDAVEKQIADLVKRSVG